MKKISFLTLVTLMAALTTFNSCKHGDNDPFLSLRSRDARIKGVWTLSAVSGKYTKHSTTYDIFGSKSTDGTETREVTYNGTALKALTTVSGTGQLPQPSNVEYTYNLTLDIKADGMCHSKEDLKYPSSANVGTSENDSKWFWVNDSKNKNNVYIQDLMGSFLASKLDPKFQFNSWYISGLKNKELEFTLTATNKVANTDKKGQTEFEEDYNFIVTFKQE